MLTCSHSSTPVDQPDLTMPQISKPYHHSNYVEDVETVEGQQADSSAQVENKRKMLRRAANRRSAQLSRARKKANLEELKIENNRLQRLVDILDSQPELVFCINIEGSISYMSERTESFMRINLSGDLSDEVPTNINQILSLESVVSILASIKQLNKYSLGSIGGSSHPCSQEDSNMLFSAKEVYFHDAFGYPLVGSLRCSKVVRRTTLQELQCSDDPEYPEANKIEQSTITNSSSMRSKKPRPEEPSQQVSTSSKERSTDPFTHLAKMTVSQPEVSQAESSWNFSNFKLLTECVSEVYTGLAGGLAGDELALGVGVVGEDIDCSGSGSGTGSGRHVNEVQMEDMRTMRDDTASVLNLPVLPTKHAREADKNRSNGTGSNGTTRDGSDSGGSGGSGSGSGSGGSNSKSKRDLASMCGHSSGPQEVEFVCVIRTSTNCFVPHTSRGYTYKPDQPQRHLTSTTHTKLNENNLLLFSQQLSTASMVAHDLEQTVRSTMGKLRGVHGNGNSDGSYSDGSNTSNRSNSNRSNSDLSGSNNSSTGLSTQKSKLTLSETNSEDSNGDSNGVTKDTDGSIEDVCETNYS